MPVTLKTIHDEVLQVKEVVNSTATKVVSFPKWVKIALAIALVAIIYLVFTVFKQNRQLENKDELMQAKDEKLKYQQLHIDDLERGQPARDSIILERLDAIEKNKPVQTRIIHEIQKIPTDVRNLDREQLRREVNGYTGN